jgi:hypothetical protein
MPYNIFGKNNIRIVGKRKNAIPDTKCAGLDSIVILETEDPKSSRVKTK